MSVQLYVQYPLQDTTVVTTNPWILLDLRADEEPIKLNLSVGDIADPLKVSSTYSRTFKIPNTQVNGDWFKSVFSVNGMTFNPSMLAPAYINDNGETLVVGNIRLNSIYREDQTKAIWYEILFMGETSDLGSNIAGAYLSDLDLSQYNHALNYNNVTNSWSGGLFNKAIRYPLVEWGYNYNSNNEPIDHTLSHGAPSSFTNSANPLALNQMKPAIQLKALWDKIIAPTTNQVSYACSSTTTITIPPAASAGVPPTTITFTIPTGLAYLSAGGEKIVIQYDATHWMLATTISYNSANGVMTASVTESQGVGSTISNWSVSLQTKSALSGYTYSTDSFMTSPIFENLYILVDSQSRPYVEWQNQAFKAQSNYINLPSGTSLIYNGPTTTLTQLFLYQELIDNANCYNPSTSEYTASAAGSYSFKIDLDTWVISGYTCSNPAAQERVRARLSIRSNTTVYWTGNWYTFDNNYASSIYNFQTTNMNIPLGEKVKLFVEIQPPVSGTSTVGCGLGLDISSVTWESVITPTFVNINALLSNQIKVTDFVKGVIDKFKLVFIPSKEKTKEFKIIPWIDWVRTGRTKDWTDKLDESIEYKISPLFAGQSRNNVFKDADDTDYLNYNYQQANQKNYGQLNLDSGNLLLTGENVRSTMFSRTPLGPIGVGATATSIQASAAAKFLIPHLSKVTQTTSGSTLITKREPIIPKMRMVFWNGMVTNPTGVTWYLEWYPVYGSWGPSMSQGSYPLVSDFYQWPVTNTTLDLRWQWAPQLYDTTAQGSLSNPQAVTNVTAFNQYWRGWYDTVYDPYNRFVEMSMIMDYTDIKDIQFNDYIWIKDAWYFVDSITDYIVGKMTNCKVKLYKVGATLGITLPNALTTLTPITRCYHPTSSCGASCCSNGSLSPTSYFMSTTTPTVYTSKIYLDPYGNIPAPPGQYASGQSVWTVGSGGMITSILNVFCVCGNINNESFRVAYYPSDPIDATVNMANVLCSNPPVEPVELYVYGQQTDASFIDNIRFFTDQSQTIPAPNGVYKPLDEVTDNGWNINNGEVWQISDKGMCNCPSAYYEQHLAFGATDCDACCFTDGTNTVWSDTPNVDTGTQLYADQAGTVFAVGPGFYSDGSNTYEVDPEGSVIGTGNCSGCSCGPTSTIDLEFEISYSGFNGTMTLEKSFDRLNWFTVGSVDINSVDPDGTIASNTFEVEISAWTRVTVNYEGDHGAELIQYFIDGNQIEFLKVPLPVFENLSLEAQDQASPGPVRKYKTTIFA